MRNMVKSDANRRKARSAWTQGRKFFSAVARSIGADLGKKLLNFGFLELHMLADHRVVLVQLQLGGLGAGILFGHVEISRVRGGNQFDLNDVRFGHDKTLQ
jgi:hypothetical protein